MAGVKAIDIILSAKGIQAFPVDCGGETPVAIILISTGHDSANDASTVGTNNVASRMSPQMSIGMATASAQHHATQLIYPASSTQVSQTGYYTDRLCYTGSTFSQDWEIYLDGFDVDEVSLNVLNAPISLGLDRRFTMIVFYGSDCEANLVSQNLGTGTSAIDITAPGFEPDIVFGLCSYKSATGLTGSGAGFGAHVLGVCLNDGTDKQRCAPRREGSGTLTVARSTAAVFDNCTLALIQGGTSHTTIWRGTISDFDASGFSITPSASALSALASFLSIKAPGVSFSLDDYLTRTTTGVETISGLPFEPEVALLLGSGATTINTPTGNTAACASNYASVMSADMTGFRNVLRNYQGQDPSQSSDFSIDDGTVISLGNALLDDVVSADFTSFTPDGMGLDYTVVDGNAYLFMGLLMGAGGGGSATYMDSRFFFN